MGALTYLEVQVIHPICWWSWAGRSAPRRNVIVNSARYVPGESELARPRAGPRPRRRGAPIRETTVAVCGVQAAKPGERAHPIAPAA